MELSLANVINVSVSETQAGIGKYNTSNIGLLSHEAYADSFGSDGYKLYLSPDEVAVDFGTESVTYAQALALFSQQPNILTGNGYLAIIATRAETQSVVFSTVPDAGEFKLNFGGNPSTLINWNDTAAQVQSKIRTIAGLEGAIVTGTIAAGLTVQLLGAYGDVALMTVTDSTLETGSVASIVTVAQVTAGESMASAITRASGVVQFFGVLFTQILGEAETIAAAGVLQAASKIGFFVSKTAADVEVGGLLDLLRSGNYSHSRGLYYGSTSSKQALAFAAAYAGRALSTNFAGSNTTQTMHLKDLKTIQPDPSMTQTLLAKCQAAGVDVYASLQGVAKVFTSGANTFFDRIYNQLWFVGEIKVAGFNALAQASTKILQTESGMDVLRKAYRNVAEQAVVNQYAAPGEWTSATTFGNQGDFLDNIRQRGYYIYSLPIAQQSSVDRAARKAPLMQIAIKEAGAVHQSDVIININQ